MATSSVTTNYSQSSTTSTAAFSLSAPESFPIELVIEMIKRLHAQEIGMMKLISRQWDQMLKRDDLWQKLFYNSFPLLHSIKIKNFQETYLRIYSNPAKGVYATRILARNKHGICSLFISDGKLFSGDSKGGIGIWDLDTGAYLDSLKGHVETVGCLAFAKDRLLSGSNDRTIKLWDLKECKCIATLYGHSNWVTSLVVAGDKVISSSLDKKIMVWDLNSGRCLAMLEDREDVLNFVISPEGMLISCSWDRAIKIWDLEKKACMATLAGHHAQVTSLTIVDQSLISGSSDGMIRIWDLKKNECIDPLVGHTNIVTSFVSIDNLLISGSFDKTIRIWDLKKKNCVATLVGHKERIESLAICDRKLISGSIDGEIRIWDFRADHKTIFEEIARELENGDFRIKKHALERIKRMPKAAQDKIYAEHVKVVSPESTEIDFNRIENSFRETLWQGPSKWREKSLAIRNYLQKLQQEAEGFPRVSYNSNCQICVYPLKLTQAQ